MKKHGVRDDITEVHRLHEYKPWVESSSSFSDEQTADLDKKEEEAHKGEEEHHDSPEVSLGKALKLAKES